MEINYIAQSEDQISSIPYELALDDRYIETFKQFILSLHYKNPDLLALIDKLIQATVEKDKATIRLSIERHLNDPYSSSYQHYLRWLADNSQNLDIPPTNVEYAQKIVRLLIRDKDSDSTKQQEINAQAKLHAFYKEQATLSYLFYDVEAMPIEQAPRLVLVKSTEQEEKDRRLGISYGTDSLPTTWRDERLASFEDLYATQSPIELNELFSTTDKTVQRKWLIQGRAGIGKTTLCKYIAWQWVNHKLWSDQFHWVFWISLRNLTAEPYLKAIEDQSLTLADIVHRECFVNDNTISLSWIEQQLQEVNKILWLLDGYDEMAHLPQVTSYLQKLMSLYPQQILTTRPSALPTQLSNYHNLENIGFMSKDIEDYVYKFFTTLHKRSQAENVLIFLNSQSSIWGTAHIPINLELICSIWDDAASRGTILSSAMSLTKLYQEIVYKLCRRYLEKSATDQSSLRNVQTLTNLEVEKKCQGLIEFLEVLAWQNQTGAGNSLIIANETIQTLLRELKIPGKDFLSHIVKSYFLKGVGGNRAIDQDYYFVHLTFQEYFAAKYWVRFFSSTDISQKNKAIIYLNKYKYDQRFSLIWNFVAGLLSKCADEKNDIEYVNNYIDLFFEEPKDIAEKYDFILLIKCINESNIPYESLNEKSKWIIDNSKLYLKNIIDCGESLQHLSYRLQDLKSNYILKTIISSQNIIKPHDFFSILKRNYKLYDDPSHLIIDILLLLLQFHVDTSDITTYLENFIEKPSKDKYIKELLFKKLRALENYENKLTDKLKKYINYYYKEQITVPSQEEQKNFTDSDMIFPYSEDVENYFTKFTPLEKENFIQQHQSSLMSKNRWVRGKAIAILSYVYSRINNCSEELFNVLLSQLTEDDWYIKSWAISGLYELTSTHIVNESWQDKFFSSLCKIMKVEKDNDVLIRAINIIHLYLKNTNFQKSRYYLLSSLTDVIINEHTTFEPKYEALKILSTFTFDENSNLKISEIYSFFEKIFSTNSPNIKIKILEKLDTVFNIYHKNENDNEINAIENFNILLFKDLSIKLNNVKSQKIFIKIILPILGDLDSTVVNKALRFLAKIFGTIPTYMDQLFKVLRSFINDPRLSVQQTAIELICSIAHLVNNLTDIKNALIEKSKSDNEFISFYAFKAVAIIILNSKTFNQTEKFNLLSHIDNVLNKNYQQIQANQYKFTSCNDPNYFYNLLALFISTELLHISTIQAYVVPIIIKGLKTYQNNELITGTFWLGLGKMDLSNFLNFPEWKGVNFYKLIDDIFENTSLQSLLNSNLDEDYILNYVCRSLIYSTTAVYITNNTIFFYENTQLCHVLLGISKFNKFINIFNKISKEYDPYLYDLAKQNEILQSYTRDIDQPPYHFNKKISHK